MDDWTRSSLLIWFLVVGLAVSAGCSWTGPSNRAEPPVAPGSASLTAADHARACGSTDHPPRRTADEIMAGRLTLAPFSATTIDPDRDGDIDWSLDPYRHPSWTTAYQAGGWIGALLDRSPAERDRAKALLRDWLRDVPVPGRSPTALICAARAFAGERWIEDRIPPQVDHFAAHWDGPWNHGLRRDLELLRIGCAYPADAWRGRPLRWRSVAREQMIKAFAPSSLGPAVDQQGAANEQSTGYTKYTYGWWATAGQRLAACGGGLPADISARVASMPTFLAHATQPDGRLAQLGDTYPTGPGVLPGTPLEYAGTRGRSGSPPAQQVVVYGAGYVFGRSGWGTARPFGDESFYSLRFGRGRQVHGHNDHMSLTYYARGRNLIVDSGHTGYENSLYREYLQSAEAHNVLVLPRVPFARAAQTTLTRQSAGPDGQFFEFTDTAYGGRRRARSVFVSQRPDLILVFDRASGAAEYQQLWHLDPALKVTVRGSYAVATASGTQLQLRQIPLPGQRIPDGSTGVIRGQTGPYQGWVSREMLQRTPAPVVSMTRTGASAAMLTLVVPTAPGAAVATGLTTQPDGRYRVDVRINGRATSFLVSPDGYINRP